MLYVFAIFSALCLCRAGAQENAGSSVAASLRECYNTTELLYRQYRPPASIGVLIDIIRKIEDGPAIQNAREFSFQLIHRFRQDGIVRYITEGDSKYKLPYTPQGFQSNKNHILLSKLVPGNAVNFPNETLNARERCSLHFMLSNTVDRRERGDESSVCSRLAKYQRRARRDVNVSGAENEGRTKSSPDADVEMAPRGSSARTVVTYTRSDCPLEDGVVYNRWGAVQAGTVIAGIATGYEPQEIRVDDYTIDSRYAATLAGDLSEAALHQGATANTITVGARGGWNGTLAPRWYFIEKNKDYEITDAEIRGGLDGLILAKNIPDWKGKAPNLKISQLLDMYYSTRGVFSKKYRACNRRQLFSEVAPSDTLKAETIGFNFLLDRETKLAATLMKEGLEKFGNNAVDALTQYIPSNLNDLDCTVNDGTLSRVATDLLIVLDTSWSYEIIQSALTYLLDNLDINKYGSSYAITNGKDSRTIINASSSVLDFHELYNRTVHHEHPTGFDFTRVLNDIEQMAKQRIEDEKSKGIAGGRSNVVLFMPYATALVDQENAFASERREIFKNLLPDLKVMVLGRGPKDAYANVVNDETFDAFTLPDNPDGTSITQAINSVISRIREVPRKIVNPTCGSDWSGTDASATFDDYVEPNSVNFYRVAPNYFYYGGVARAVKVQGQGYGNLQVCSSRQNQNPRQNSSTGETICKTISASSDETVVLTDGCNDYGNIASCLPSYISVEAPLTGDESASFRCTDAGCRFPDNIKYRISLENLGCASGSCSAVIASFMLLVAALTLRFYF